MHGTTLSFGGIVNQIIKEGSGSSTPIANAVKEYFSLYGDQFHGNMEFHRGGYYTHKEGWQDNRKNRAENFNPEDFKNFVKSYYSGLEGDEVDKEVEKLSLALDAIFDKGEENSFSKSWNKIRHSVTDQREDVALGRMMEDYARNNPDMSPLLDMGSALQIETSNQKTSKLIRRNFEADVYLRTVFNENKLRLQVIADEVNKKGAYVDPETFLLQNTDELTPSRVKEINKKLQDIKGIQEKTIEDVTSSYGDVNTKLAELQRDKTDDKIIATASNKLYGGLNSFLVSAESSFEQLALAVPMLFQNDAAIGAFASLQKAQSYPPQ